MTNPVSHQRDCACATCGRGLTGALRDLAMTWPDCVFALAPEARVARAWRDDEQRPDFVVLDDSRFFVRGLLPVPLHDGGAFRYGVWLEVTFQDFRRVFAAWPDDAAYARLRFTARLANQLRGLPESTLGCAVEAAPRDVSERPVVLAAHDDWLANTLQIGRDEDVYAEVAANSL